MSKNYHMIKNGNVTTYIHNEVPGLVAYTKRHDNYITLWISLRAAPPCYDQIMPYFLSEKTTILYEVLNPFWGYDYVEDSSEFLPKTSRMRHTLAANDGHAIEIIEEGFRKAAQVYKINTFKGRRHDIIRVIKKIFGRA
jgi:hypothetical protein